VKNQDPVNVIGHDDETVQPHMREAHRDRFPTPGDNLSQPRKRDGVAGTPAKKGLSKMGNDGDEVDPGIPVRDAAVPRVKTIVGCPHAPNLNRSPHRRVAT
jgi:hypothetical protein